jgi:CubicO group peptidase (beta-lactamase class C family)
MPDRTRSLPSRPSLRYLKLEAKRRVAAGEFPALHQAQAAIAREHGQPSWMALRQVISDQPEPVSHALAQVRWIIDRFAGADEPGWTAPGEHEMRLHFDDRFLAAIPADDLVAQLAGVAANLRDEVVVIARAPLQVQVRIAGFQYLAAVEADPPHRLIGLQGFPLGARVTDPRVTARPAARSRGEVPAGITEITGEAFAELGLPALALAGGGRDTPAWAVAQGWADLDSGEILDAGHVFPAPGVTALVTATAVLRLVADGRLGLDSAAAGEMRTVRLADDTITIRELLSHTAGVDSPAATDLFADHVPDLAALLGPVIACSGPRGVAEPSNGGYAVLGQLIADVTGSSYADAVTALVLDPLAMSDSRFPASSADLRPGAVTGYDLTAAGVFVPVPARICTIPAIAGLWATAADLVRLGAGWDTLLPAALAREALTPQAESSPGGRPVGLGWLLGQGGIAAHAGGGPGATATLVVRAGDHRVLATLTSRMISLDPVNDRVLRSWTGARTSTG